jgi:Na+/melibiose symporter-like transporter
MVGRHPADERKGRTVATDRTTSLWRHRDFVLMWSGQTVSLMGSEVSLLAVPLTAAVVLGQSTFHLGLLSAVGALPPLLVPLVAGVVVDRSRKRRVMAVCDALRAVGLGSVAGAAVLHVLTIGQLYVVVAANATCDVFFNAAYRSFPATMLDRDQLLAANGRVTTGATFASVVGPSIGGALVAAFGAARALGADALSYAVNAVSLLFIRHREPVPDRAEREVRMREEMTAGLRYLFANRVQRPLVLSFAACTFFLSGLNVLLVVYAVRGLHWSPRQIGLVYGAAAVGGVVGSLVATRVAGRFGLVRTMMVAGWVYAPGELVIVLVHPGVVGQVLVASGWALMMVVAICNNVANQTLRQLMCPPYLLGRMNAAARLVTWGGRPLAGLLAGGLGTALGMRGALAVFGVGLLSCPLVQWLSPLRGLRSATPEELMAPAEPTGAAEANAPLAAAD